MNHPDANTLIEKYKEGTLTDEEKVILETWYVKVSGSARLNMVDGELDRNLDDIWLRINSNIGYDVLRANNKANTVTLWKKIAAAAAIVLALSSALYFYLGNENSSNPPLVQKEKERDDVAPGGNKAILTLADGSKISLNDAANGEIAKQAGIQISKTADGQLVYKVLETETGNTHAYNTIETPNGGQYQILLPDGSKVWLNAASSLKFPASFLGLTSRKVELKGEAYFEIAKDKAKPFLVSSNSQTVEVLGTHFNINAYTNESLIKTTLIEGSVKISQQGNSKMLKPGEQAQVKESINIVSADIEDVLAWKNGKIQFTDQDIQSIMRMLARWYNIEVVYEGEIKGIGFGGSVSRYKNLSDVLKILEMTGDVHFKIEGRRVTVMP